MARVKKDVVASKKKTAARRVSKAHVTDLLETDRVARKTTVAYKGHLARADAWLASEITLHQGAHMLSAVETAPAELTSVQGEEWLDDPFLHPLAASSFATPSECTPLLIAWHLTERCVANKKGLSTAEGIHAAFKDRFTQMYVVSMYPKLRRAASTHSHALAQG